jgi:hypothetical protein
MLVKAVSNSVKQSPEHTLNAFYRAYSKDYGFGLKLGDSYAVYGIKLWRGMLEYLTCDKINGQPFWNPAELFEILDYRLPSQWSYKFLGYALSNIESTAEANIEAIWGYHELIFHPTHFIDLMLREGDWAAIFEQRKNEIDEYFSKNPQTPA